jgi:hypothetical protein
VSVVEVVAEVRWTSRERLAGLPDVGPERGCERRGSRGRSRIAEVPHVELSEAVNVAEVAGRRRVAEVPGGSPGILPIMTRDQSHPAPQGRGA